ncbi:hypothetical protein FQN50_000079 [Emmonsiellopsis sp. PD_5]|nr:hypothetical protein FQN50_000079 [Emmonsiellopsis sp. PD_5]
MLTSFRWTLLGQSARSSSHPADSPEAIVVRELGNEYLHLPAIVEAAESSPGAAKEAANHIRRFLSNPSSQKGYKQYNAVMLIRILVDNPGDTFTRNFDAKFVGTVKDLLRDGRDMSVQQILRETMEFLSVQKASDPNLKPLSEMWKKEKQKFEKALGISAGSWMAPQQQQQQPPSQRQDYFARQHRSRGLPAPGELSSRISEANTSAKLLHQLIQSTPTEDFLANDLLREFSDRCQSAARSIVGYINSTNPPPDEDTMLTLIETNDRLAVALSKYQRAALVARKTLSRSQSQDINVASQNQMHADHPQPGPLTTSATAPQPNQIATIKQRTVPILSLPRKALNKLRSDKTSQAPEPAPSAQQEQEPPSPPRTPPQHRIDASSAAAAATLTRSPQSAISPVQSSPPTLRANPPTATLSSSIAGAGAPRSNGTTTTATATSTSAAYQYNSSDFTVENPFADTYSSSHFDKDHDHHDASARATAGAAAASTNADTQPMTSSTYYPGSGFSLFDPNMPGSRPADDSTVPVPASAPVEQSATERFYAGRKVEGAGAV